MGGTINLDALGLRSMALTRLTEFLTNYLAAEDVLNIADAFVSEKLLPQDVYGQMQIEGVPNNRARLMVSSLQRKVKSQPSDISNIIDLFKRRGHLTVAAHIETELGKL